MDFRVNKVGDNWDFLPQKEKDKKKEYERLVRKIEDRENKIERAKQKIKDDKNELREWKKQRTKGYRDMVKYHKKFSPNFSVSLNFGGKYVEYKSGNYAETSGNNQWELNVRIGGKRKYIYIGTISSVALHLDLLENRTDNYFLQSKGKGEGVNRYTKDEMEGYYQRLKPNTNEEHRKSIKSKLEFYINENVRNLMIGIMKKDGNLNKFFNKNYKIKGVDILYNIYKSTPHYVPPRKEKPKKKGKRLRRLHVGKGRSL